jgi:SIR2-like domain
MSNEMRNVVLLAGAGASFGVSRERYPTTRAFYERFVEPKKLYERTPFRIADDFIRSSKGLPLANFDLAKPSEASPVDIEEILFAAHELRDSLSNFRGTSKSITRFASHHLKFQDFGAYGNNVTSSLENASHALEAFIRDVDLLVHEAYGEKPSEAELDASWVPFLRDVSMHAKSLDVFTTNYDLVLEMAIRRSTLDVDFGYKDDGATRELNLAAWTDRLSSSKSGALLTKLHGSVHWLRGARDEIEIGGPSSKDYERQVALYPGYKGVPTREPFKSFHDYLADRLAAADVILVVGFAFRDEYINQLFRTRTRPEQTLLIVDPRGTEVTPDTRASVEHCQYVFGSSELPQHIRAALAGKPMPKVVMPDGIA